MCGLCQVVGVNLHGEDVDTKSISPGFKKLDEVAEQSNKVKHGVIAAIQLYGDPANFPPDLIDRFESGYLEAARLIGELRLLPRDAEVEQKKGVH